VQNGVSFFQGFVVCGVLLLKEDIFIGFVFVTLQNQTQNILKNKSGVVGIKWGSSFLGFAVSEVLVLKKENFFSALILITTKPSSVF
jgi:hypothetical protein